MDNPEKTGNTGHTRRRENKAKTRHHYAQASTNTVSKI